MSDDFRVVVVRWHVYWKYDQFTKTFVLLLVNNDQKKANEETYVRSYT